MVRIVVGGQINKQEIHDFLQKNYELKICH